MGMKREPPNQNAKEPPGHWNKSAKKTKGWEERGIVKK